MPNPLYSETMLHLGVSSLSFDHKPTQDEYKAMYHSFENTYAYADTVLNEVVLKGRTLSFWCGGDGTHNMPNWYSAQYVGVDLEKHPDALIDKAVKHRFYTTYGAFGYTTLSHQWDDPRCRLVFFLSEPCKDVETWHWGALAIAEMWGVPSDLSSADRGRSFLGCPYAETHEVGKILPSTTFTMLAKRRESVWQAQVAQAKANRPVRSYSSGMDDVQAFVDSLVNRIVSAPHGTRNSTLNRAAFLLGRHGVAEKKLSHQAAVDVLVNAATQVGLPLEEATRTVQAALQRGISSQ